MARVPRAVPGVGAAGSSLLWRPAALPAVVEGLVKAPSDGRPARARAHRTLFGPIVRPAGARIGRSARKAERRTESRSGERRSTMNRGPNDMVYALPATR